MTFGFWIRLQIRYGQNLTPVSPRTLETQRNDNAIICVSTAPIRQKYLKKNADRSAVVGRQFGVHLHTLAGFLTSSALVVEFQVIDYQTHRHGSMFAILGGLLLIHQPRNKKNTIKRLVDDRKSSWLVLMSICFGLFAFTWILKWLYIVTRRLCVHAANVTWISV